jgi:hypothetical protein
VIGAFPPADGYDAQVAQRVFLSSRSRKGVPRHRASEHDVAKDDFWLKFARDLHTGLGIFSLAGFVPELGKQESQDGPGVTRIVHHKNSPPWPFFDGDISL